LPARERIAVREATLARDPHGEYWSEDDGGHKRSIISLERHPREMMLDQSG
jgi:hypothetical protein